MKYPDHIQHRGKLEDPSRNCETKDHSLKYHGYLEDTRHCKYDFPEQVA